MRLEIRVIAVDDDGTERLLAPPIATENCADDMLVEGIVIAAQTTCADFPRGMVRASTFGHSAIAVGFATMLLRHLEEDAFGRD